MDEKLKELNDQLLDLNERAQSIQAAADADKRPFTEEEQTEVDGIFAKFEQIEAEIERRKAISAQTEKLMQSQGRKSEPQAVDQAPRASDPAPRSTRRPQITVIEDRGKWG